MRTLENTRTYLALDVTPVDQNKKIETKKDFISSHPHL